MKSITETFVFNEMNSKLKIIENIKLINFNTDTVSQESMEEYIKLIQRRMNFAMKNKVLEDYNIGDIVIVYPEIAKLPKLMPVFIAKVGGKARAVLNIKHYSTKDKAGNINVDTRTLFALMQSATILLDFYNEWNKYSNSVTICRLSTQIYVKLFNKILDKLYGVNLDIIKSDKINYIIAKFFLINIMGKTDNDTTRNIAYSVCKTATKAIIEGVDSSFPTEYFKDFNYFIEGLSKIDGLQKLNTRVFWEQWMLLYGESTIYSTEFYPSLTESIFSAMLSARINKEHVFESLIPSEILNLYNEIARLMK